MEGLCCKLKFEEFDHKDAALYKNLALLQKLIKMQEVMEC